MRSGDTNRPFNVESNGYRPPPYKGGLFIYGAQQLKLKKGENENERKQKKTFKRA